ncbi:MAG: hypothetical protein ACYDAD_15480 [Acidimicrobiales bacterium]
MATDPSPDLLLRPLGGPARSVREWVTTFHLVFVALDPFEERSAWLVETAARILGTYSEADCRVAFVVAGNDDEARQFLGRHAEEVLTFVDPDLAAIRGPGGFGLATLPAIVHLDVYGQVVNAAEGWDPPAWRALTEELSRVLSWKGPVIPGPRDPAPFDGVPVTVG